jgi:hypothetical protein
METGIRPLSLSCFASRSAGQDQPDSMGTPQASRYCADAPR